jgi:hypothetical protein
MPGKETVWKRELSNRDEKDHYVYIIAHLSEQSELCGPVKIGLSSNPISRLATLQTGSASKLVLVGRYAFWRRSHALEVEQVFHRTAAVHRTTGEWFDIEPDSAVAMMAMNIRSFVANRLQPVENEDFFFAMDYLGLPGFAYDLAEEDFKHS